MTNAVIFLESYLAGGSDYVARLMIDRLPATSITAFMNRRSDASILRATPLPSHAKIEYYDLVTTPELIASVKRWKSPLLRGTLRVLEYLSRYPLFLFSIWYFRRLLSKVPIDVFIANNGGYPGGSYCRSATIAAATLKGVRVYHVVHSMAVPARRLIAPVEWLIDKAIGKSSRLITVCEATADQLDKARFLRQRALVIHNGIPDKEHQQSNGSARRFQILHIGYFERTKNQAMLIRAVAELDKRGHHNLRVRFLGADGGDGSLNLCKSLVVQNGLTGRVLFEGFDLDVERYYASSDVFVLCSLLEGFPISILEAMRASIPVVASDVGGTREQVTDGVTGFLIPTDDHQLLADRIETLLRNEKLRIRLGSAGRLKYERKFSADRMIARYAEVLGLSRATGI